MAKMLRISTLIALTVVILVAGDNTDVSSSNEHRETRSTGRVVKQYSGIRPEPIQCIGEGFQADAHNCEVFYRCVKSGKGKFTVFRFQCGPGTVYDPETEVCSHPGTTKRSECGGYLRPVEDTTHINDIGSMQSAEIPSPIATYKPIYIANSDPNYVGQQPIPSETNHFASSDDSYSTGIYNRPINTENSGLDYNRPINSDNSGPVYSSIEPSSPKPIVSPSTTSIPNSSPRDNICTSDGFIGDSENCHKFYRCVGNNRGGFTMYSYTCSEPTIWDEEHQTCNHAWAVKRSGCINHGNKIKDTDTPSSTKRPQNENTNNINTGSNEFNNAPGPVLPNPTQVQYENQNDKDDTNGYHQNQINGPSQTSNNYGQEGHQTQLPIDQPESSSHTPILITTTTLKTSSTSTTQKSISEKDKSNSIECTDVGFIGDPFDCSKFYRCVNNEKGGFTRIEFSCAEGTVWDQTIETCNHAWAVKECGSKGVNRPQQIATTTIYKPSSTYYTTTTTENYSSPLETADINNEGGYVTQKVTSTVTTSLPITTNTSSSSVQCSSSGFMGDSNDCKKFYRCVESGSGSFIRYEFSCGEGTVWDPKIEGCNHAWAVDTCGGNTLPDTSKIETTTRKLVPTSPQIQSTTTTTHLTTLVKEDEGSLKPGLVQHPDTNEEDSGYLSNSNDVKPTTTTQPIASGFQDPNDPSSCTSEGFMGDQYNCKIFYRCVSNGDGGFTRYQFDCGEGTVWDQTILSCNHAWAVDGCGNTEMTTIPTQTTTTAATTSTATTGSTSSETVPTGTTSSETVPTGTTTTGTVTTETTTTGSVSTGTTSTGPVTTDATTATTAVNANAGEGVSDVNTDSSHINCSNEGFVKDPNNCKKFYRCVDDGKGAYTKYSFNCGEGTYWSQETLSCDHITSDNECGETVSTTKVPQYEQAATSTEKTTTSKNENTSTQKPAELPGDCTSEGMYGEKYDCKRFYRCVDNGKGGYIKYDFVCGEGTIWDQEILACNHETESKCTGTSSGLQPSTGTKPVPDVTPSLTDDQNNNNTFITTTTEIQTTTSSTVVQKPPSDKNDCTSEGYYENKNNCREYYKCTDDGQGGYVKQRYTCNNGTAWDSQLQRCNYIDQVPSCKGSVAQNQDKTETTTYSTTTSDSSSTTTVQTQTSTTSGPPTQTTRTQTNSDDSCNEEGYFGNSQDCKKFYRCVSTGEGQYSKYDFNCGEGTIWDQVTLACNHPENVLNPSCENGGSSSTTSTDNQDNDSNKVPQNNKFNCTKAGFYANPYNCKKFYRCVDWNGDGIEFSIFHFECGEGTIWDPSVETCNYEHSVYPPRNCSGSQPQEVSTTESTTQKSTQQTTPLTTETLTTESQETTTKTSSETTTTEPTTTTEKSTESTTNNQGTSTTENSTTETSTTELTTTTTEKSTTTTTTDSTTENLVASTTEQLGESTTDQGQTSTTVRSTTETTESTTSEKPEQTTTDKTTVTTTASTTEITEQTTTDSTTVTTTPSTTQMTEQTTTDDSTTVTTTASTTEMTEQTTTDSTTVTTTPSTTQMTEQTTTDSTTVTTTTSTTEMSEQSTTDSTTVTTTASTTESSGGSTTEQLGETTTDQSSTTETSSVATTEQSQSTTDTPTTQDTSTETTITTTQPGEYTTTDATVDKNSTNGECPDTDEDQYLFVCPTSFRRHPKYCNMFYQCDENDETHDVKIATFTCPNNTIYDETKIKCVEESKADKKCEGEIAPKRRVKRKGSLQDNSAIEVTEDSLACPFNGYFMFEKGNECSPGFLKCMKTKSRKLRGFVYQCPEGYIFWSVSRRCEPIHRVSDCKRSTINDWSRRWEIPIETKNVGWS